MKSFTLIIPLYNAIEGWKILINPKSLCRETLLGINPVLSLKRIFPKNKL